MFFINRCKVSDEALVKTFAVFCNVRFDRGRICFDFFKFVVTVDFPALQKTDINGICRAEKGAPHTHIAMMLEPDFPVFLIDILLRAGADAFSAVGAFFVVNRIQERVYVTADFLDPHKECCCVVNKIAFDV